MREQSKTGYVNNSIYKGSWRPLSILSCCEVQQGDPLGPLCFALTLQPIVERIKREVPSLVCNVWYLDDGTLCGTPQDLDAALKIIEEEGPPRGLHLNRQKSLLYIPPGDDLGNNPLLTTSLSQAPASASLVSPLVHVVSVNPRYLTGLGRSRVLLEDWGTLKTPNCKPLF